MLLSTNLSRLPLFCPSSSLTLFRLLFPCLSLPLSSSPSCPTSPAFSSIFSFALLLRLMPSLSPRPLFQSLSLVFLDVCSGYCAFNPFYMLKGADIKTAGMYEVFCMYDLLTQLTSEITHNMKLKGCKLCVMSRFLRHV